MSGFLVIIRFFLFAILFKHMTHTCHVMKYLKLIKIVYHFTNELMSWNVKGNIS